MSKKRTMIVIEPDGRIHKEAFMTAPMVCPYCNGRGGFSTIQRPGLNFTVVPTVKEPARSWQW